MKTIFVTLHNTFAVRNLLRSQTLAVVRQENIRVVCLVVAEKIPFYREEFPDYVFEALPVEIRKNWLDRLFKFFTIDGLHTNSVRIQSYGRMFRHGSRLVDFIRNTPAFLFERLIWNLGGFSWWRPWVRFWYRQIPSQVYRQLFDTYQPTLVFAANMINAEDYRLVLEAKQRGIKTVGMVLSWDNLTSKVFLQIFPDHLIVHNDVIRDEVIALAGYPASQITVTGVPQYDGYFQQRNVWSREDFCRHIGADPSKKIILYAASGKASILFDIDIVTGLAQAIDAGVLPRDTQILVRPYPRYDFPPAKIEELRRRAKILIASPVTHGDWEKDNWEFGDVDLKFLTNSLAHADVVITMSSTFLIEGAVFDKPVISSIFNVNPAIGYWSSAERFLEFEHLAALKNFDAFPLTRSFDQLFAAVNEALANPQQRHDRRQALIRRQCVFTDGRSAERLGQALLRRLNHYGLLTK